MITIHCDMESCKKDLTGIGFVSINTDFDEAITKGKNAVIIDSVKLHLCNSCWMKLRLFLREV